MKFGVIGSGSWGTALVKILTDTGHEITWCVRHETTADHIKKKHCNPHYLRSVYFSENQFFLTTNPAEVFKNNDAVVLAVPSAFVLDYLKPNLPLLGSNLTIISAVKGMLPQNNLLLNQWLMQEGLGSTPYIALMGPCHAEEVAAERLSYLTFAGVPSSDLEAMTAAFKTPYINTVLSNDIDGVQYAAVLKNVYALGAGIAHGLGYGDNFQSVLIANAAGEMNHFLQSVIANPTINYATSAYLGDLLVTCYSLLSRNRAFGTLIGKGSTVEAAKISMQMVAEGYPAAKAIHELNQGMGAQMPIAATVFDVLWKGKDPALGFEELEQQLR